MTFLAPFCTSVSHFKFWNQNISISPNLHFSIWTNFSCWTANPSHHAFILSVSQLIWLVVYLFFIFVTFRTITSGREQDSNPTSHCLIELPPLSPVWKLWCHWINVKTREKKNKMKTCRIPINFKMLYFSFLLPLFILMKQQGVVWGFRLPHKQEQDTDRCLQ